MPFLFEKLDVYRRALDFADRISVLTARFARPFWYLADQLNRASLSIALNIAEGNGRGTPMDKRRFLLIARGSAFECVPLLDMCKRKGLFSPDACSEFQVTLDDLCRMLSKMIDRMGSMGAVREEAVDYV
jgi:four helix bundle protein